ncbi:MAG TPA: hypothetical protein VMT46_08655 [Anaerolineaceae bacterium]|nr:hypothetical protein [Anaerolineaceae bacterium]
MNEENIGSNFDDFLSDEGLLEKAEAIAVKRVLAFQVKQLVDPGLVFFRNQPPDVILASRYTGKPRPDLEECRFRTSTLHL